MKYKMIKFWELVIKFIKWYMKRNKLDMANGFCWTMGIFMLVGTLLYYFDFLQGKLLASIVIGLFIVMIIIAYFLAENKWIRRFTRGKFATSIEVLKNFLIIHICMVCFLDFYC